MRFHLMLVAALSTYSLAPALASQCWTETERELVDYSAHLGASAGICGTTAVVGASSDDGMDANSGAAYVLERNAGGFGTWGQVQKLVASDGTWGDLFGASIAIDEDFMVVGARDDDHHSSSGSAYVFVRDSLSPELWVELRKLTPQSGDDLFGCSVAIDGDRIVVGASGSESYAGSAYIFERDLGGLDQWGQRVRLTASDGQIQDEFGFAVSIDAGTVVVGARAAGTFGAAYIFERDSGGVDAWGQSQKVVSPDVPMSSWDDFGFGVAIEQDTLVVGARSAEDAGPSNRGSAYVFHRDLGGMGSWGFSQKLVPQGGQGGHFGETVALDGDALVIGAGIEPVSGVSLGAAYVFERANDGAETWSLAERLVASDGALADWFGGAVAVSNRTVLVGAQEVQNSWGSCYIYEPCTQFNDDCSGASPVDEGANAFFTTPFATPSGIQPSGLPPWEGNELPDTACQDFGHDTEPGDLGLDVWHSFTPMHSGAYLFSTCQSANYDSKLALYSGGCSSLIALACNDQGAFCLDFTSELRASSLLAGQTYLLQVGGFDAQAVGEGILTVTLLAPVQDSCDGARVLSMGANYFDSVATTASGIQAGGLAPWIDNQTPDTACQDTTPYTMGPSSLGRDAWYSLTPDSPGQYLLSTCGTSSYDTKLAIYSGTCSASIALACNDDGDGCVDFSSELRVSGLVAGTTYLVQVGSFDGTAVGSGMMDVSVEEPSGVGTPFCQSSENSVSSLGAFISASGSTGVAANDLVLECGPVEVGEPALFFYSPTPHGDPGGFPFGEGRRCTGGGIVRLNPPAVAGLDGRLLFALDNTVPELSSIQAMATMYFQCWYRDPSGGDADGDGQEEGFNLSNALTIQFTP